MNELGPIAIRGIAYRFNVALRSQADTKLFQANPTLAAGDAKVSKDGGAFANLATLPQVLPAGGKQVQVDLDATAMDADLVGVLLSDAAGAEWCDHYEEIQTTKALYSGSITGASPTTTTLVDSGLTQADSDFWVGRIVIFTSGSLRNQATKITGFTPASDQLSFNALTSAPAQSDRYVIL